MIHKFLFTCILIGLTSAQAQSNDFTLKQCIEYAWLNNLDVRQSILNSESAKIDQKQSKTNLLPSFSLSAGQNYQFGRTIDRFTNQFINQTIRSNNIGLNGSVILFNGLQNQNNIKQQDELQKASEENIQNIKNTIALNIANAFLQTIQAEENIKNAQFQMESTKQRIDRAQKMVDAGTTDLSSLLSLKAQLANEQLNLVTAENSKNSAVLNLKILMQMPSDQDLNLVIPEITNDLINNPLSATELYQVALYNMPQIKSAVHQSDAARFQAKMTRGNLAPTISLFGSISTVYSQNSKTVTGFQQTGTQVIGYTSNGNDPVIQPVFSYQFNTIGFNQQLKDNLGQSAGISLSWNLLNGFQVQNQIQKAKINVSISELNLLRAKSNLLNEINAAVNTYNAAKARHDAAVNNVDAQKLSLDYIQKRFDAGASTSFDFIQSKNNYLQAQSSEIQARFELVFRGLILEFYKGNPINL